MREDFFGPQGDTSWNRNRLLKTFGGFHHHEVDIRDRKEISGKAMQYDYTEPNRKGDHMCYISDLNKMRADYPKWDISKDLEAIIVEIYEAWMNRSKAPQ